MARTHVRVLTILLCLYATTHACKDAPAPPTAGRKATGQPPRVGGAVSTPRLLVSTPKDVRRFEPSDGSLLTVYSHEERGTYLGSLCPLPEDRVFVEACPSGSKACTVRLVNLRTQSVEREIAGAALFCLPEKDALFYYVLEGQTATLVRDAIRTPAKPSPITRAPVGPESYPGIRPHFVVPPIAMETDSIAFVGPDESATAYSLRDASLRPLGVPGCVPRAWRESSREILCTHPHMRAARWVSLDSGASRPVSGVDAYRPLVYYGAADILLTAGFERRRRDEFPTLVALDSAGGTVAVLASPVVVSGLALALR